MSRLQSKSPPARHSSTQPTPNKSGQTQLRPHGIFPGWGVLIVAGLALFASSPGQSFSVATFKEPMKLTLDVSDTSFATVYLVATLVSGVCLPFLGRQIDRYGARLTLPLIAAALGGACYWMSLIQGLVGLYIGFCMVRPLGQGALTLISTWLVGHWFERRRGMAMGLLGLGGTLSVMTVPQINYWVNEHYGWRTGWICLAVGVWVILVIPALVLVRNRPEDIGWLPDGRRPNDDNSDGEQDRNRPQTLLAIEEAEAQSSLTGWRSDEAWRTVTFWKLLAPLCAGSLVGTGLIFHQMSIFAEQGLSGRAAVTTLTIQATVASVGALFFGYLTDRLPPQRLIALAMLGLGSAQLILFSMPQLIEWQVISHWGLTTLYGLLLGSHGAILRTAGNVVWVNYYGRLHQGSIRGIVLQMQIVASALGPLPFALARDYLHSYSMANLALLILPIGAGIAAWTAHPPVHKSD